MKKHFLGLFIVMTNSLTTVCVEGNPKSGQNGKQYEILCRIYNLAMSPPKDLYDPAVVRGITTRIDQINASISDEAWFNEVAKTESEDKLSPEFKRRNGEVADLWARWRDAVQSVNEKQEFVRLRYSSPESKKHQAALKKIEAQVTATLGSITLINKSADISEIQKKFGEAIFGEGTASGKLPSYTGSTQKEECGGNSRATDAGRDAGRSLILDLICLCADHSSYNDGKACLTGTEMNGQNWKQNPDEQLWKPLREGCDGRRLAGETNAGSLKEALGGFALELSGKTTVDGNTGVPGLFGILKGNGASGCTGQWNTNEANCIIYNPKNIPWLTKLNATIPLLEGVAKARNEIANDIVRLKMLEARAEQIYEAATTIFEKEKDDSGQPAQNQSHSGHTPISTDNPTAHQRTLVNTATISRFIIPWTLLI